jgi:hypothetical protein
MFFRRGHFWGHRMTGHGKICKVDSDRRCANVLLCKENKDCKGADASS